MTLSLDDLDRFDTIIVTSADVTGRPVGKRFPPEVFRALVDEGVALSSCVLGWDLDQWPGPVQSYTGHHTGWHDVRLVPDLRTLRPAAWLDSTAICLADFVELERDDLVEVAPRTILRRQVEAFGTKRPIVASELEFGLYLDAGEGPDRLDALRPTHSARADYTIQAGDRMEPFFADVRAALRASDLGLWTSQVEWGLGQWEVNLRHGPALDMADRHLLFKLAMHALAARHGLAVTFMAKPFAETTGSSCHLHLSIEDEDGTNVFGADGAQGLPADLRGAIGGVLDHAAELMIWYAPTVNSYRRTVGEEFSGHGRSWGFDSRMVSVRVLRESPASTRLEWRVPGADVDPYLAIAGLLASARDGIARGLDPGPPLVGEDWQREVDPLPRSLGAAVESWRSEAFPEQAFGKEVADHYGVAAAWEWESFLAPGLVTAWERRRYFDHV